MEDLKKSFEKEPKTRKYVLGSAAVAFISSFLPWISYSYGPLGSYSQNGWTRFGLITAFSSLALVLLWVLPRVGVKFKLPAKEEVLYKVLAGMILAGAVLWLWDSAFSFSFMGFGFYIGLAAGVVAVYFSFFVGGKKAAHTGETSQK